jgi:hypothetical protein
MTMKQGRKEKQDVFDLDTLLHPARAFNHPMDVVRDADLTLNEKRALLASWASDACALEGTGFAFEHFGSRRSVGRHHGCAPSAR